MSRHTRNQWREISLSVLLAVEVAAIFLSGPVASMGLETSGPIAVVVIFTMVAAVMAAAPNGALARTALLTFILYAVAIAIRLRDPSPFTYWLSAAGGLTTVLVVSWVISVSVFAPGHVSSHRIRGAIVLYFNMAIAFSMVFRLLEELKPGSFSGVKTGESGQDIAEDLLYFSIITLSTTGFGDIVPVSRAARSAASLEAVVGQLYIATFLGRLITLRTAPPRKGSGEDP